MSFRLSSTPVGSFLDCKRKWYLSTDDLDQLTGVEIDFGSLGHAFLEVWADNDFVVPDDWVAAAKEAPEGDYGTIAPLFENEKLVEKVLKTCLKVVQNPVLIEFLDQLEIIGTEVDLTPLGVEYGGVLARGRIDLLCRHKESGILYMLDYKTRGDLRYAPKSHDEFENNPQFALYSSVWHQKNPEPKGLRVFHINILRDSGKIGIYGTHFEAEYLEKMARYFDKHLVPEMVETFHIPESGMVEPDFGSCYKYGPCPYIDTCGGYRLSEDEDFLTVAMRTMNMKILSNEAPAEIEPTLVPEKPVSVLDGATSRIVGNLQKADVFTLKDLREYEGELLDIKYLGEKTKEKLLDSLEAYYGEYTG